MIDKLLDKHTVCCMKIIAIAIFLFILVTLINNATAQTGNQLHQSNCIACHAAMTGGDGSVLYTRKNRRVNSMESLAKQVNRCQSSLGLNWSTSQQQNVQMFLNETYYHF